jgi:hypothetical protein
LESQDKEDHQQSPKGHLGWWQVGQRRVTIEEDEKEEKEVEKARGATA